MNSRHLIERFAACRERGEPLVLVTVWDTLGSTYSKPGTRMLITAGGESQGLVSGGCLEGDLAERARDVLDSRRATTVTYDLRDEADELFGLGIGCNGLISVLLQPLHADTNHEPMTSIANVLLGQRVGAIATVIDSDVAGIDCGASVVLADGRAQAFGVPDVAVASLVRGCEDVADRSVPRLVPESSGYRVLYAPLLPVPRVLILGAGLDAVPLVNILAEVGWRVSIADHRPGYLQRAGFEKAEEISAIRPSELAREIDLNRFDAIVVMTHHLATDREILRQLASVKVPYLGLLGPPARKARLIEELGDEGKAIATRLRGPVGIDIGADTAESIAVSIAAEIQQVLVNAV